VEVVVKEVGYREPYIENQGVEVEWHWVEWCCCCGRRNLDGFSNRSCKCLSRDYFVGIVCSFASHWRAQRLGKWIGT